MENAFIDVVALSSVTCSVKLNVPLVVGVPEIKLSKVSFGTRSDSGLKTHSIIPTLVQTARRQGVPRGNSYTSSTPPIPQRQSRAV
jgi:hypothetical protein